MMLPFWFISAAKIEILFIIKKSFPSKADSLNLYVKNFVIWKTHVAVFFIHV